MCSVHTRIDLVGELLVDKMVVTAGPFATETTLIDGVLYRAIYGRVPVRRCDAHLCQESPVEVVHTHI